MPSTARLGTDHLHNGGDIFALLLLSLMLLAAPLLLVRRWRWYFLLWSPLVLLVLPYTYLTLIYNSVPGDALLSSALSTSPAMSWRVVSAFGWRIWLIPLSLLIYMLLACMLPRDWVLSAEARKRLLAALLLTIMLALIGRQTVARSLRLPPLLEQSTLNLAFPSGLVMSLARIARQQQGDAGFASVHGQPAVAGQAPPVLVVLVIGESLRSDHLGINGYPRNTTPQLAALGGELLSFPDAASTANWTSQAVPGIVALPLGRQRASLPHTFAEAGFRTAWLSNQETLPFSHGLDVVEHAVGSQDFHLRTDANLLPLFSSFVRQAGPRQFAVLHLIGSHIPYEERYTAASRIYTPTLSGLGITQPQAQHRQATINSYDNTVIETDRLLARVIATLRDDPRPAILLYTSDHGENLFDDARQLFMHAQTGPTRHDIHVPLLAWMNKAYRAAHPAISQALQANHRKQVSHRDLFATLLDAGGVRWDGRDASHSLASPLYRERPRSVMVDLQSSVCYESLK